MTGRSFSYDRKIRELLQGIPKRFKEVLIGKKVIKVLDPTFPAVTDMVADLVMSKVS